MIDYKTIDADLYRWAASRPYTVQTRHRDDEVRAFEMWSPDNSRRAQIGVSAIDGENVELIVFDGERKREKLRARKENLNELLNKAEALAKSWLVG